MEWVAVYTFDIPFFGPESVSTTLWTSFFSLDALSIKIVVAKIANKTFCTGISLKGNQTIHHIRITDTSASVTIRDVATPAAITVNIPVLESLRSAIGDASYEAASRVFHSHVASLADFAAVFVENHASVRSRLSVLRAVFSNNFSIETSFTPKSPKKPHIAMKASWLARDSFEWIHCSCIYC